MSEFDKLKDRTGVKPQLNGAKAIGEQTPPPPPPAQQVEQFMQDCVIVTKTNQHIPIQLPIPVPQVVLIPERNITAILSQIVLGQDTITNMQKQIVVFLECQAVAIMEEPQQSVQSSAPSK